MKREIIGMGLVILLSLILTSAGIHAAENRGMGVPPEALPDELKGLDIKDYFVPSSSKKVGVIHAMNEGAHVVVIHRATKEAYFGKAGDIIHENDSLNTLDKSRCRIKFFDDDVVSMAANTEFSVESFEDQRKIGKKTSLFSMFKGKAMFYALRLFKYEKIKFTLKTPTAVAGVRGTKFAAGIFWVGMEDKRADAGVMVADSRKDFSMYLARNGGGKPKSHSDFHSFDGNLQVTAQVNGDRVQRRVSGGNSFNGQTGNVGGTPANVANQYNRATTVTTQGTSQGTQQRRVNVFTRGQGNQGNQADMTGKQSDTTQQQTGQNTQTQTTVKPQPLSGTLKGYFAALVTDHSGTPIFTKDAYVPDAIRDTTSDTVTVDSVQDWSADSLTYDDTAKPQQFKEADFSNSTGVPAEAITVPVTAGWTIVKTVFNAYQWGYWAGSDTQFTLDQAGASGGPAGPYAIDNKVWRIEGFPTADGIMNAKTGSYAYSFDVDGTYWSNPGGIDISGSGSCNVNFTSDTINNFGFEALSNNNQYGAKVSAGTGNITGSTFSIDNNGATYELKDAGTYYNANYGRVKGAFYGDNAKMGFGFGIFGNNIGSNYRGAAGVGHDARDQ